MQSILFIMRYFLDCRRDSLSFKFKNQIQAARNIGLDVWYMGIDNDNTICLCHEEERYKLTSFRMGETKSLLNSMRLHLLLYRSIPKIFNVKQDFDFVYMRSMILLPSLLKALKVIQMHGAKTIIEEPTYPITGEINSEKRLIRKMILLMSERINYLRNKYVDLFTLIGDPADSYMNKPALNIENGICIDMIPMRVPPREYDEIHCLGLACMARWHGYDRFIRGMYDYKRQGGTGKIIFHLVGDDGDGSLEIWKQLALDCHLQEEVIFEGPLFGSDLDQFINQCDIGVGTLGGYRNHLGNSSTLKIREFTARGLPFIYAVEDKALKDSLPFALKFPDNDTPIDIQAVAEFVKKVRREKGLVASMREYAKETMSWEKQFTKVVSFFNGFQRQMQSDGKRSSDEKSLAAFDRSISPYQEC